MDVLVVLGTTAAWVYGFAKLFIGHAELESLSTDGGDLQMQQDMLTMEILHHTHNWEMSATLIVAIMFGKLLEAVTKKQTVDKLSQLANLKVTKAFVVQSLDLGSEGQETDVEMLIVDDLIKVLNG